MEKLAVDFVLLPPKETMEKAIEVNGHLLSKALSGERKIVLGQNPGGMVGIPHISLSMGVIYRNELDVIKRETYDVSKSFDPLRLRIKGLELEMLENGKKVSYYQVEKTSELQELHERLMRGLSDYVGYDATIDMMYNSKTVEPINLDWINSFRNKSSFGNFHPHITLGVGDADKSPYDSFDFIASKLAVCHLGNYCTCRDVLYSVDLTK